MHESVAKASALSHTCMQVASPCTAATEEHAASKHAHYRTRFRSKTAAHVWASTWAEPMAWLYKSEHSVDAAPEGQRRDGTQRRRSSATADGADLKHRTHNARRTGPAEAPSPPARPTSRGCRRHRPHRVGDQRDHTRTHTCMHTRFERTTHTATDPTSSCANTLWDKHPRSRPPATRRRSVHGLHWRLVAGGGRAACVAEGRCKVGLARRHQGGWRMGRAHRTLTRKHCERRVCCGAMVTFSLRLDRRRRRARHGATTLQHEHALGSVYAR